MNPDVIAHGSSMLQSIILHLLKPDQSSVIVSHHLLEIGRPVQRSDPHNVQFQGTGYQTSRYSRRLVLFSCSCLSVFYWRPPGRCFGTTVSSRTVHTTCHSWCSVPLPMGLSRHDVVGLRGRWTELVRNDTASTMLNKFHAILDRTTSIPYETGSPNRLTMLSLCHGHTKRLIECCIPSIYHPIF
jgi:hypothetical protein